MDTAGGFIGGLGNIGHAWSRASMIDRTSTFILRISAEVEPSRGNNRHSAFSGRVAGFLIKIVNKARNLQI